MKIKSIIHKLTKILILMLFVLTAVSEVHTAYAANLTFYNYSTGKNENYTGKQVVYTLNNRRLSLSHPGIIINGIALADHYELFARELGLQVSLNSDSIIFSDGTTELILVIGSNIAWINGTIDIINVAPVKLKFGDEIKYYVPTRYVAETFGFSYVWVSDISTVKITKTLSLVEAENSISYNGSLYQLKYQDNPVSLDMPAISYKGNVMVPAKQVFENAGCLYEETANKIIISKKQLTLTMERQSKISYVNEKKIIAESVPVEILDNSTGQSALYVALEFVADVLGFELQYAEEECCYTLQETVFTGCIDLYPDLLNGFWKNSQNADAMEEQPLKQYFEWNSENDFGSGYNTLTKVVAYSLENADVLELFGVTKSNINGFIDNGMAVFELNEVSTTMEAQFFSDFDAPHLNYALLTPLKNNIKLIVMMAENDQWTLIEKNNSVQIYFSSEPIESSYQIYESPYPDDVILIPLPEQITRSDITDEDHYSDRNFTIQITGNHMDSIQLAEIINPYYGVVISDIYYNIFSNQTVISFTTNNICGYKYYIMDDYLCVKTDKPGEIYSNVIILDAGHGGIDPGASKNGYKEKDLNFKILNQYTKELFKDSDIKVYFTRETDVKIDLYERAAMAAEIGADLFISLHMNANNSSSVNGTQVFYSSANNEMTSYGLNSYQLAKLFVSNLSNALGTKNRGASNSEFVVVKYNTVPAVLIELGFMTNAKELKKLTNTEFQQKAAETIYQTVLEVYEGYLLR